MRTLTFASGMAAISAVLFSQLRAGDAVVLPDDGYQALPLVREQLTAYGIEVRTAPTGGDAQLDVLMEHADAIITLTRCTPLYSTAERIIAYGVLESWRPAAAGPPAEIADLVASWEA